MSNVDMKQVKELRDRTQAGLNDCRAALIEAGGEMEKAVEVILKKGLAKSAKRAGAIATEGVVAAAVASDGKLGVLVEVNIQTDFAARNADFLKFVARRITRYSALLVVTYREEEVSAAHPLTRLVDMWPQTLAILGFLAGTLFGVALGIAAARRRFGELSMPLFTTLGAAAGLLLGMVLGAPVPILGVLTVASAIGGAGSLALARRAEARAQLGAGGEMHHVLPGESDATRSAR